MCSPMNTQMVDNKKKLWFFQIRAEVKIKTIW